MTTARKIAAIGVVAALGVMAWTTLRNPDPAADARPDGPGAPGGREATDGAASGTAAAPAQQPGDPSPGTRAANPATPPPADMPRHLRELDDQQIAARFAEMLDPGDCGAAREADGPIARCNAIGVGNERLQAQLQQPDPRWTPMAQRQLETAVEAAEMRLRGRIRIVDARCGTDICQLLAIAPTVDHDPPGGWDDQVRAFPQSRWWRELGMADMKQLMAAGPDGHTIYYVTQLEATPRR